MSSINPFDLKLEIPLKEYLSLLYQARSRVLASAESYCLITKDQKFRIESAQGYDLVCVIKPLDEIEIDELKRLNIIREQELLDTTLYKVYDVDSWKAEYERQTQESELRAKVRAETLARAERVENAIRRLQREIPSSYSDYKFAKSYIQMFVLKGLQPEIAKMLKIEDLVSKD